MSRIVDRPVARAVARFASSSEAVAQRVFWPGALILGGLLLAATVRAQDDAQVEQGRLKFEHTCAPCHGAGVGNDGHATLPGTEALQIKYNGTVPALLEERTDLTADVLKVFVRNGTMSMPPFRPTEITDAEIENIAAYLAETSRR